jgi:oligopeptide transport system substrate-binding protein
VLQKYKIAACNKKQKSTVSLLDLYMRLIAISILLLILSGCTNSHSNKSEKTVFRYNEASGVTSLDPAFASNQANIWACNQLFNGLVSLNDGLIPQPCIAKSWTISPDGKTYSFILRDDVYFHSGAKFLKSRTVNASDFVYSFNRIIDPKVASPGSWIFNFIEQDTIKNLLNIQALNDTTLSIQLKESFPPFLGLLSSTYCSVVPHEAIEYYGKDFRKNPIGTGPFKFFKWFERSALVFHKNENYFEKDENGIRLPYLDAVMISFIPDKQSAFMEFLKGKIDLISGLDASYKDDLLNKNGSIKSKYKDKFKVLTSSYLNTEYLGFAIDLNQEDAKNPLNDLRIRKAINYAFDRGKMIRYLRNNMASPGSAGFVPIGSPGFNTASDYGYNFNPEKAKALLKEAGYPNGEGLPTITMSTTNSYQDLCEFIQGQLAEIGIKVKVEVNQAAQHRQMVSKHQLSWFRGSWIADYSDPENYLSLFYSKNKSPNGPNYTHFENAFFDTEYEAAMRIQNDSLRTIKYHHLDSIVMSEAPVVVLYYDKVLRLHQNNIDGLGINGMNLLTLKNVRKKN